MKPFTIVKLICYFLLVTRAAYAQIDEESMPSTAPSIRSFALQPDLIGASGNSVNLFTGDVTFPVTLLSLPGRGGMDVSVQIAYNSNVHNIVKNTNQDAPTGIVGLGWNLDMPRIVCDHKNTGTREDDTYYLLEGGSSNRLVKTVYGTDANGTYNIFEAKNYLFWKIKYYSATEKWVVLKEDGKQFIYGDNASGRNTVQYIVRWGNWIGNSSQVTGQSQMSVGWSLSQISNAWNDKVTFGYEVIEQFVGSSSGQKQTEACYLKEITDVIGRKVQFFYNTKSSSFYSEPHTEKSEPDAYQEVYERKYLDRIELLDESGMKKSSVHLTYSTLNSGNFSKMLLTSIIQKNANGVPLPGLGFTYFTAGGTAGYLQTVSYPMGGSVTYSYLAQTISKSNRKIDVTAPAGYGQVKAWIAEDYVVVAWRQNEPGGSSVSASPRPVQIWAYQWQGRWVGSYIGTFNDVSLVDNGVSPSGVPMKDYKKFHVQIQRDFFAVMSDPDGTNYCKLYLAYKSENPAVGNSSFMVSTEMVDAGDGDATLLSGESFVVLAPFKDDDTHPLKRWVFRGDGWNETSLNQTTGDHYYTSGSNYFMSHNQYVSGIGQVTGEIYLHFLSEDKQWVSRRLPSTLEFGWLSGKSYWYGSDNFAVVMAGGNPEFIYRWDESYNNFVRDSKDAANNDLFGVISDVSLVNIISNSLVSASIPNGTTVLNRFDGKSWYRAIVSPARENNQYHYPESFGEDIAIYPVNPVLTGGYNGVRKVFNPNTLQWNSDVTMGSDASPDDRGMLSNIGRDYYRYGYNYYFRNNSGTWTKSPLTKSEYQFRSARSGSPSFDIWSTGTEGAIDAHFIRNSTITKVSISILGGQLKDAYYYPSPNRGVGVQTVITTPPYRNFTNTDDITIRRLLNDEVDGPLVDYPVNVVAVDDGTKTTYSTYQFSGNTAVMDPTGTVAQYHEVKLIPGIDGSDPNLPAVNPFKFGYTKHFFYNGLPSAELSRAPNGSNNIRFNGLVYKKEVYNAEDVLIGEENSTYAVYSKDILNSLSVKLDKAGYVRKTEQTSTFDGITQKVKYSYNANGMPLEETVFDYDSKVTTGNIDQGNRTKVSYKYFNEAYDQSNILNILSPVIQVKKSVVVSGVETVESVAATTWRAPSGIWAPHKSYVWKRTGSSDFDFATWSNTGEPSSGWTKVSQVDLYDAYGNVVQVSKP